MTAPLVYLILGIPSSGRREILFDLFQEGLAPADEALYFSPAEEPASPFDEQIEALENVHRVTWQLEDCQVRHGRLTASPSLVVFLAPGRSAPPDVAEALRAWTDRNQCRFGRIITVVHCSFLLERDAALPWFDACIHFSDVVLLNRRENVPNKWVKTFEQRYHKERYPCRFLPVKKGRVANPAEVLEPEARRLSLYFDELIPIEDDAFEALRPEDQKPDKYIERLESGQRARPIPEIGTLLD